MQSFAHVQWRAQYQTYNSSPSCFQLSIARLPRMQSWRTATNRLHPSIERPVEIHWLTILSLQLSNNVCFVTFMHLLYMYAEHSAYTTFELHVVQLFDKIAM